MIDYQIEIIEAVKRIIKSVSVVKMVGEYPEHLAEIGNRYPAVLVKYAGEQQGELLPNRNFVPTINITLQVHIEKKPPFTMLRNCLSVVNDINAAMLTDLSFETCIDNTIFEGVSSPDYDAQAYIYELNYTIQARTLR